jgi:hypothetical protein
VSFSGRSDSGPSRGPGTGRIRVFNRPEGADSGKDVPAQELKRIFPESGALGTENTHLVTPKKVRQLTVFDENDIVVQKEISQFFSSTYPRSMLCGCLFLSAI